MKRPTLFSLAFAATALLGVSCDIQEPCIETTWFQDADGDGLGNPNVTTQACEQPEGYVSNGADLDETGVASLTAFGYALEDQIANGDGAGIDNAFRNSGMLVDEAANTYFAVNGVHPVNSGDYSSYYPKSLVEASLETDEIVNAWSFDASTLGRQVDMEGLCFAEGTDYLYIGDEYNFIYELERATGQITREWDLADIGLTTNTDRGIEALTYHNGYFYAGIQQELQVYQLDLHLDATDPADTDYQTIESISSFSTISPPSGLFATSSGEIYMAAFGNSGQNLYKYSLSGDLLCSISLPSEANLQRPDGVYLDSSETFLYIADSQGMLNGYSSMYRIAFAELSCE